MANKENSNQSKHPGTETNLLHWEPEDNEFWEEHGKSLATRNLWISIPNLLLGFAVWIIWSVVIVSIQSLHDADPTQFAFSDLGDLTSTEYKVILYSLPAVAGLAGATLRIPNSFMISISGGRNVIASTTLLLLLPMAALGIALQDPNVSFLTLIIIAAVSGVGGGAFASSMSNISFFFPKRVQGTSLGLNAGLGNVGVSVMQLLVPIVISVKLFGFLTGDGYTDGSDTIYIQNAGLVWVPLCAIFLLAAWFKMSNLPQHDVSDTKKALSKFFYLELIGFIAAGVGVTLLMVFYTEFEGEPSFILFALVLIIISVVITLTMMRYGTQPEVQENLVDQFKIFNNKHNWIMTWLYIMTFGSFIGFSAAFPKLIKDSFGYLADGTTENPDAPNPLAFAWLGPLVGSLARPIGGWMSDKWGGARVTQYDIVAMILTTLGVGYTLSLAKDSDTPEDYFTIFLVLFLLLFITTGIGNGSTFRMVPMIFEKEQAGPVLGWTSAIAAYGAFIIPLIFGVSIAKNVPEYAMYGFATYYLSCLVLNWYYYARKNAEMPC